MIIVNTPMQVMMQKMIDDDYKGRVFSILETMAMALMPLGVVIYGFLYDIFPAEWILIVSSLLLIGVVLVLGKTICRAKSASGIRGIESDEVRGCFRIIICIVS